MKKNNRWQKIGKTSNGYVVFACPVVAADQTTVIEYKWAVKATNGVDWMANGTETSVSDCLIAAEAAMRD